MYLRDSHFRPTSWATGSNSHKCFAQSVEMTLTSSLQRHCAMLATPTCSSWCLVSISLFLTSFFLLATGEKSNGNWVLPRMYARTDCSELTLQLIIYTNQHKWPWSQSGLEVTGFGLFLSPRMSPSYGQSNHAHACTCICEPKCFWRQVAFLFSLPKRERNR